MAMNKEQGRKNIFKNFCVEIQNRKEQKIWKDDNKIQAEILKKLYQLKNTPSGSDHASKSRELQNLMRREQEELFKLIFSGKVKNADDVYKLINHGGYLGSVSKKKNIHWIPFLRKVYERRDELPGNLSSSLNLLWKTHKYGED